MRLWVRERVPVVPVTEWVPEGVGVGLGVREAPEVADGVAEAEAADALKDGVETVRLRLRDGVWEAEGLRDGARLRLRVGLRERLTDCVRVWVELWVTVGA